MKNLFKKTLISALGLTLTVGAFAAESAAGGPLVGASQVAPGAKVEGKIPLSLQLALQGGMKIEKQFKAAGGMTGWILSEAPGKNVVAYTTPDGEALIAGTMLNQAGQNLTEQYLEKYGTKIDYDKFWAKLEASSYVAEGAKGADVKSTLYVFKDPNCSYCHLAWRALQPYEKVGLQVRWIPVAFLAQDSAAKAAVLLTAKDPDAAVAELHANYGKKTTPPVPSAQVKARVDANTKLMAEMGFKGTPATLYKDAAGKVIAVDGMPRLSQLPKMTGLPEQANSDPDLARFR